ncbi:MAG TPA: hypothetical protein VF303_02860 [Candidatus Nanoarchaeia archaeon]
MSDLINLLQNDPAAFLLLVGALITIALLYTISVFVNFAPTTAAAEYYQIKKRSLVILSFVLAVLILVVAALALFLEPSSWSETIALL